MKKIYALFLVLILSKFQVYSEIHIDYFDCKNNLAPYIYIENIKNDYDGNLYISFMRHTDEGDKYFLSILNKKSSVSKTLLLQSEWGKFYVLDEFIFLKDNNFIQKISKTDGICITKIKSKDLFYPQFDDVDKRHSKVTKWYNQNGYIGINYYNSDLSFKYSFKQLPFDKKNVISITNGKNDDSCYILVEDENNDCKIFDYDIKKKKYSLKLNLAIELSREADISLSPDNNILFVLDCFEDRTYIAFYNLKTESLIADIVLPGSHDFSKPEWSYNSDYIILFDNNSDYIYKMFF